MTEYLLCLQSETPLRKERRFYLGRIGGSLAGACPRAARRRLVLQNRFVFAEQCSALRDGGARRRRDLKRPYGEGRALSRIGGRPKVAPTGARRMKPRRARCPHRAADRRKPPSPRGGCPSAHTGVAIRSSSKMPCFQCFSDADRHTSDIGHWFAMTGHPLCLQSQTATPLG